MRKILNVLRREKAMGGAPFQPVSSVPGLPDQVETGPIPNSHGVVVSQLIDLAAPLGHMLHTCAKTH